MGPLPPPLVPLVGREAEEQAVIHLFRHGVRLITLRGPGGIGKTALAAQVGRTLHGEYDLGSVLVELAGVTDTADVLPIVARALGVPLNGRSPLDALGTGLGERSLLLILDNFEQLLPAALEVRRLLDVAPHLRVLVTSRVPLHLHGEQEYEVGPLGTPEVRSDVATSPAAQLLVAGVRRHDPAFTLEVGMEPALIRLCRSLEGVPLALELAAVATRTFTLPDLAAHLDWMQGHFRASYVDRPERLRSMRAAVEWSYALLPADLQDLFACCAVFHGGFTLEAAAAVWGSDTVMDLLPDLLEQSLLQRVPGPASRWRMLEPLREVAREKLAGHPNASSWQRRHADHYVTLFERFMSGSPDEFERTRGHLERPNLNAALNWAVGNNETDLALRGLTGMGFFHNPEGGMLRGFEQAQEVLALPGAEHHPCRPSALHVAWVCVMNRDPEQYRDLLFEWVELSRTQGNRSNRLWSLVALAAYRCGRGETDQGLALTQQVFHLLDEAEQEHWGDLDPTRLTHVRAWALHNLSVACRWHGDLAEAQAQAENALAHFTRIEHVFGALTTRLLLAGIDLALDHSDAASAGLEEVIGDVMGERYPALAPTAAYLLAELAQRARQPEKAVQFAALAEQLAEDAEVPLGPVRAELEALTRQAKASLSPVAFEHSRREGARLTLAEAWAHWQSLGLHSSLSLEVRRNPKSEPLLTPREREVLVLVAQGHPDRRIARLLGMSPTTASKHVANLLAKLEKKNRVELARWALTHTIGAGSDSSF